MLLKKLRLENFRQFIGKQEVVFSTDSERNVTIIMGENGSGKTAFAQAFTWCLYGETDFQDRSMLNKAIAVEMLPENNKKVRVDLYLSHRGTDYTMTREQNYKKKLDGLLNISQTTFNISYKRKGQQEFLSPGDVPARMKKILPKELSRFFFFDGERIGNMSKDIHKGRSNEFGNAVRGLLGLNAFISALDHLNPRSKYGVIGSYSESYDASSNSKISEYTKEIDDAQDELNKIDKRLENIEKEIAIAQDRCGELSLKIQQNSESEAIQNRKDKLKLNIEKTKTKFNLTLESMLKQFNNNASSYFAISMIKDTLEQLSNKDKISKGIPDIHARTIEYLINRHECICGAEIKLGNDVYMKLNELLKYIPPQSIGTAIDHFVKESSIRTKTSSELFNDISINYATLRGFESDIENMKDEIITIENNLKGMANVSALQTELMKFEKLIRDRNSERDENNIEKGSLTTTRERFNTKRSELALRDNKNRKIEIYKAYAKYMHVELTSIYKNNEDQVRKRLEKSINDIFKSIYEGGLSLTIDEKYNIQVLVDDFDEFNVGIETSTSQSISIIFAFISGIIKLARENSNTTDNEIKMLDSEPYPLVMDAPLSAFDKRRIKNVCDALPKVAEQVIIFIKDTDGDIATENMSDNIGKRYIFNRENEFVTYLVER